MGGSGRDRANPGDACLVTEWIAVEINDTILQLSQVYFGDKP